LAQATSPVQTLQWCLTRLTTKLLRRRLALVNPVYSGWEHMMPESTEGTQETSPTLKLKFTSEHHSLPVSSHAQDYPDASRQHVASLMNAAIDEIGVGPYQLIVLLLGGGVYMAEGSFLLMLSIVAKSLVIKWQLSPWTAGAMASVLFAGLLVGTIAGGFACDHHGRRMPILVTYLGISVFTLIGILAPGLLLLLAAKLMLGFCLGFGVPAANAIVAESCPSTHRSSIYCLTMVLFSTGQLYSATIVWIFSPTLNHKDMQWRWMLAVATLLPLMLLALASCFLQESPHWLLLNSSVADARGVVTEMLRYKQLDEGMQRYKDLAEAVSEQSRAPACSEIRSGDEGERTALLGGGASGWASATKVFSRPGQFPVFLREVRSSLLFDSRLGALFSSRFRVTTVIMLYVTFASNFAYYGMIYGLPDTLKRAYLKDEGTWSPAAGLFLSAIFEIPGVFLAVVLGMTIGRRKHMSFAFFGCAVSLIFTLSALASDTITDNIGLMSVLGVKLFLATGYIISYLYLLECYPTKFRATGLAFCMVFGRLGAAACPFLFDGLVFLLEEEVFFFVTMAVMVAFASFVCWFLPYETKDAVLEEDAPPGASCCEY